MGMNTERDRQKQRIATGNFIENNGRVLRTINILRHTYNKLKGIKYALEDISEDELLDSINFLYEEGYIQLRNAVTKEASDIADSNYTALEAKLTGKGIRLLAGGIHDPLVSI